MTHALNLTMPIKQDAETQAKLKALVETFSSRVQPLIEDVLEDTGIVHFARVLVIDDKYIQIITTFDGDPKAYAETFRQRLKPVFSAIFELAADPPDVEDPDAFLKFNEKHNVRALGSSAPGVEGIDGQPEGWLFCAYGHDDASVANIKAALNNAKAET